MVKGFSDREQIRVDKLTSQLVVALMEKMSTGEKKVSKSELFRSAIFGMAKEQLTPEEFLLVVESALSLEKG